MVGQSRVIGVTGNERPPGMVSSMGDSICNIIPEDIVSTEETPFYSEIL